MLPSIQQIEGPKTIDTPAPPVGPHKPEPPLAVLRPPRAWRMLNFGELWRYRELVGMLAWRDIKVRYAQTLLGAAWAVLQPGMMMLVFTLFIGRLAGISTGDPRIPYHVFVYAGLLPWGFFAAAVLSGSLSVVGGEQLITKVYFPRLALPFAAVGAATVDFIIAFGLLLVLMLTAGVVPGWSILLAPVVFALVLLAAVGMATLLAGLHVAYRDFRFVTPFLVQLWMFATPTIYMPAATAAEKGGTLVSLWLQLNPLASLVDAFRCACLGEPIAWGPLSLAAILAMTLFLAGCFYFRRVEIWFADII
jgi:lipopolysaccharide transport system permease protein